MIHKLLRKASGLRKRHKKSKNYTPLKKHHLKHLKKLKIRLHKWQVGVVVIVPVVLCAIAAIAIYLLIFKNLPSPKSLSDYKAIPLSTHIYDRNGKLLYEVYKEQNRTPISLKDLPKYVYQASIAIEDKDFYKHRGISFFSGVLRAGKEYFVSRSVQGGSTITQQLVKGGLLSSERTLQRKLKEMVLALQVEQVYTKDQILEMYLNQVPYGGSTYGIEEASKTYFNKHAKDLTIAQAALLGGLPQAPSLYSPFTNPDLATRRRNDVLQKMLEQKYITKQQYDDALKEDINITPPQSNIKAPHFVFYVKKLLEEQYGTDLVEKGGLHVTTTLDMDMQDQAQKTVQEEIEKVKNLQISNGAALVTRPPTGEILAMVGSIDYFATASGAFNVVADALRQPGSSIKPLNYAVGIDRHIVNPATLFLDVATCFPSGDGKKYCPVNYDGQFHGAVPLRYALGNSFNIPAVKMLALNGVPEFIASASALTINTFVDPSRYGLSLTLGGGEVHMTEMAQAYSALANKGKVRTLNAILKVTDNRGKTLFEFKDTNFKQDVTKPMGSPNFFAISGKRVFSPDTSFLISDILADNGARVTEFGPASALVIKGRTVSVKTGTTDDIKDNWTIGYTPNFLTAVWVGNNNNKPMNRYLVSGITGAAPIWNKIMSDVLKNQPDLKPIKPDTVVARLVCSTGGLASKNPDGTDSCAAPRNEYFIKGTENAGMPITTHEQVAVTKDSDMQASGLSDPNTEMKDKTVLKDAYSTYCLDCAHPGPTPTPGP